MATVTIRGREKILSHFISTNESYWKLYNNSDTKTPIQTCLNYKDVGKSKEALVEILDSIDPSGTYILDTFPKPENADNKAGSFLRPNTSMCFSLSEASAQSISITKNEKEPFAPASMQNEIALIKQNAKLEMEVSMYKTQLENEQKKVLELEAYVKELEEELDELEEEEEEEAESIGGIKPPKDMQEALSRLVVEHGGAIIESVTGGKGGKIKTNLKFDEPEQEQEQEGEVKISGINDNQIPDLMSVITELQDRDKQFHKHMFKLLLVARQKPITFNLLLKKLEEM